MTDGELAELLAAWTDWERAAASPPRHPTTSWLRPQTARKIAAVKAAGLPLVEVCVLMASARRRGRSVPDAVQEVVLILDPNQHVA